MKCRFCDFEIKQPVGLKSHATTGLWIIAPEQEDMEEEDMGVLFGVWNQRTKERFWICGACAIEKLMGG